MKAKTVYIWKEGTRMRGDAQAVGERIESIRVGHKGDLEPVHIVNDARDTRSPLHQLFEWNDRKAAETHRLEQAGRLIRCIEVKIESGGESRNVRAYVSLPDGPGRKYHTITSAMSNGDLRAMVIQQALDEAEQYKARYEKYHELGDIFAAIESTAKRVRRKVAS